ncbi:glycosyltransferase family 4 protein [Mucilaginibacter sp. HMF5004]|uniref:glycosyltransferase family 4 protein n=1 Tax=Mucilaginibacter rivuli TaxID=2857527 RepID=UPI001C5D05E4|nr:glycosyltransferase family 4 protein [Mucilaginibacter rivuli]MBW4890069.1 glycosyltransferase family 4 protein [Mucilaginibacter rivuli]
MLTVNYITRPWFFDISIEFIREFKNLVNLNVIIIISPESAGYLGISDEDAAAHLDKTLKLGDVLKGELYHRLNPYFEGANVLCKFEQHKESSYKNALGWHKLLRNNPGLLKADLNIIETLSLADWYLLLKLRNKKIYYIIHDPQPHTGEGRGRTELINKLYFPYLQKFITYSEFSAGLFKQHYPDYANKVLTFKMPIFTSQKLDIKIPTKKVRTKKIVFFGRLSPYKGVELFYDAAAHISKTNPDINFVIAGKAHEGYAPPFLNNNPQPNIEIRNHFIGLEELAEIMTDADLCVLPYFDATQSGVIMTCYAFNLPVLVSDCPGLLEYCFDKENFSFTNKDLQSLTDKMENLITNEALVMKNKQQIVDYSSQNISLVNSKLILAQNTNT